MGVSDGDADVKQYFNNHQAEIQQLIADHRRVTRSMRVIVRLDAEFTRLNADGDPCFSFGYFASSVQHLEDVLDELDLETVVSDLLSAVDNWNSSGSGWTLVQITRVVVCMTVNQPLHGKSYIPSPPFIANKMCCVNVQNKDNRCFEWAVLSCLYPADKNTERPSKYADHLGELKFDGIDFPVRVCQIPN